MQESLESRKQELRVRPATINMMIPMNIFEGGHRESESGEETLDEEPDGGGSKVRVKVLVKKGNKQQTKQMYIPGECSLVQGVKEKEAAEMEEKRDIKKKILEYNEREEDEGNAALMTGNWPSLGSSGTSGGAGGSGNNGSGNRSGGQGRGRSFYVAGGYHHGYSRRR